MNDSRRDDVRKIILSLLLSRQGSTPVSALDKDYYEIEGEYIPWRKYGYASLLEFLKSMPEHFKVEWKNGVNHVHGIASQKSKHVSSLVARQKTCLPNNKPKRHYRQNHYTPNMQPQKIRIPIDKLNYLVQYVRNCPNGISINEALVMMQTLMPHIPLSMSDLNEQLYGLLHQLCISDGIIRAIQPLMNIKIPIFQHHLQLMENRPSTSKTIFGVPGDEKIEPDTIYSNSVITEYSHTKKFEDNFKFKVMDIDSSDKENRFVIDQNKIKKNVKHEDISSLISEKTKSRLEQLVRKKPDGIWCAELPNKYFQEYKMPLNYMNLGFNSVREYVSYMPDIFYITQKNPNGDFIVYSADKKPINENEKSSEMPNMNVSNEDMDDNREPALPSTISSSLCKMFAPKNVMGYGEKIGQIPVADLCKNKQFLEVYIVEVFTPSFFWIHLRENKKNFDILMGRLQEFYSENNSKEYAIPSIALKKNLNCVCVYDGLWHRAVIKTVKPDLKVTVMFYDYGTLKTYESGNLYYLHQSFSNLPAQAIPCGLYNVRPCVGDRWKKSITDRFLDKIAETLLAATIASIDIPNNSMQIVLTDTSEDYDVQINSWLIEQHFARSGNLVGIPNFSNLLSLHYNNCKKDESQDISNINKIKDGKSQLMSGDKEMLSDIKNNITEKDTEPMRKVPPSKETIMQMIRDINSSVTTKTSDINLQSKNDSIKEKPKGPRELIMLFEKLKALNTPPESSETISCSQTDRIVEDNMKRIHLDAQISAKKDIDSRNFSHDSLNERVNVEFTSRDSDTELDDEYSFGTFRSLYGGHGMMESFDWSRLKDNNSSSSIIDTSRNNLESTRKRESNKIENKLESRNQENKPIPKQYFLNAIRNSSVNDNENKYWLPKGNIDCNKNVSQSIAKLRARIELNNDKHTTVIIKNKTLEALCNDTRTSDVLNTNIVQSNNVASLKKDKTQEVCNKIHENIGNNTGMCEIKTDQSTKKNVNSNTSFKLSSSDINDNCSDKSSCISVCVDNSKSTAISKVYNSKYKFLLEQIRLTQTMNPNFTNTKNMSNNEQIQSSCRNIQTRTSDKIISNKPFNKNNGITRFNRLCTFMKSASTLESSNDNKSDNKSQSNLSSENNSTTFSIDSNEHQPNATDNTQISNIQKPKQSKMEKVTSNTQLNFGNLSSPDKNHCKDIESVNECRNNESKETTIPVFNDCDLESDESEWDVYFGNEDFSFMPKFRPQSTEISDNLDESENLDISRNKEDSL